VEVMLYIMTIGVYNTVQCLWYCWTPNVLARLLMTPFDLLHSFISDSTSHHYNLSFTMSSDPLMSCLGAVLGSLLCLSRMLTANWLTDSVYVYLCLSLLKSSHCVRKRRHLVAKFAFPVLVLPWIPTILLRRRHVFILR
jgi:hypothetical protein